MDPGKCKLPGMERFETKVKKEFGKRLKRARIEAAFEHAKDVSDALGVDAPTYRSWERGQYMPTIPMLTRICQLLNVEPNDLMPMALKRGDSSKKSTADRTAA